MARVYHMFPGDDGPFYCGAQEEPEHAFVTMWAAVTCRACQRRFLRQNDWLTGHETEPRARVALKAFVAAVDDVAAVEWNAPDLTIFYGSGVPPANSNAFTQALDELRVGLHGAPPFHYEVA